MERGGGSRLGEWLALYNLGNPSSALVLRQGALWQELSPSWRSCRQLPTWAAPCQLLR